MNIVHIEKLVFGGQGLGRLNGKVVFVWNALPGEEVEVSIIDHKKTHLEAIATRVIEPSRDRVLPLESHYLSCSPWQIISFEKEREWKIAIAKESYEKIASIAPDAPLEILSDEARHIGYRNKMEYSFAERDGKISLAFFDRGSKHHSGIEECVLADPRINTVARRILAWINEEQIPIRSLKSMIVRTGNGKVIDGLFIKDKLLFHTYPALDDSFIGFQLFYSTHKSPASVPTALIFELGSSTIAECILDMPLEFNLFSFFQINPPLFECALRDIKRFLDPAKPLLDLYSGVGAISLPLFGSYSRATLIDSNADAITFANRNIEANHIANATAHCAPAERLLDAISKDSIVILDPPRAGLHQDIVKRLLEMHPERVIYLSCNLATQARDIKLLSETYHPVFLRLYNFFPRTPHIEGLCVLQKNSI